MPVADPANISVGEIDSDMESAASDLQTWMRANLAAGAEIFSINYIRNSRNNKVIITVAYESAP
jgi:hypothetical protein